MNTYCGPFALGFVLGTDADDGARRIRAVTAQRSVHGVSRPTLWRALHASGVRAWAHAPEMLGLPAKPTLAAVLPRLRGTQPYIVCVTGHYIVVRGRKIYDNQHPNGLPRAKWPHRRKRVLQIWEILP